jgi:cell division protein FtsB
VVLNFEWAGSFRKVGSHIMPIHLARALRISLAAGLAAYCILSTIAGPAGVLAYERLLLRRLDMERNLGVLATANSELRAEVEALSGDADRAAREARSLGYLAPGEVEIVLDGWTAPSPKLETGTVLPFAQPTSLPDDSIKGISLGVVLATLAISMAPRRGGGGNRSYWDRRVQRASRE